MNDLPFRFGNECYTWFMKDSGAAHANRLDHMIKVTAQAGMAGIQPIASWMGDWSDPDRLAGALDEHGIELAALSLVLDWNEPQETAEERRKTDDAIALLKRFPGAVLCTVQMPTSRNDVEVRRKHLVANVNAASRRAAEQGIECSFHPNSPPTSITRTHEDYEAILDKLDAEATGWTPDVGHIANADMDPLAIMKQWQSLINHVHYKDWDGEPEFALMGEGKVDLIGITQWLKDWDYSGWIVCEDEAEAAVDDPDGVTLHDGRWIRDTLLAALR
jgi:inosose dehydratase